MMQIYNAYVHTEQFILSEHIAEKKLIEVSTKKHSFANYTNTTIANISTKTKRPHLKTSYTSRCRGIA